MVRLRAMPPARRAASALDRLRLSMREADARPLTRWEILGLALLVLIPTVMNAIFLSSEVTIPVAEGVVGQ